MERTPNMADVLIVSAPLNQNHSLETFAEENLGILYIEASLKHAGYSCSIIDGVAFGLSCERILNDIIADPPTLFLGFSVFFNNITHTIRMIKDVRKMGFKGHISIGGMWPSFKYKQILNQVKEVDSVAVGEGESLSVCLADSILNGKDLKDICGLATRGLDDSIHFIPEKLRDDNDILPVPDRCGYYFDTIKAVQKVSFLSSRGCHGGCTFCSVASYVKFCGGKKWRPRDPVKVVDEIEHIVKTTGINRFRFWDDNFIGPGKIERQRSMSFADEVLRRKLDIEFSIFPRLDGIEYELVSKLKDAGLKYVDAAIESLVDTQLKRYNKQISVDGNFQALDVLNKLDIPYKCYLIFFDPYVTREEIKQNLLMMDKIGIEHFAGLPIANFLALNQYQPIFNMCLKDGLVKNFNPEDIDNLYLEYTQMHSDVVSLVDMGIMAFRIHTKCFNKLFEMKKRIPSNPCDKIFTDVYNALKISFHKYFREFFDSGQTTGGTGFMYSKMGHIYDSICTFADAVTREDIMEFKEHTIDIDGIEVSTLLAYTDYLSRFNISCPSKNSIF